MLHNLIQGLTSLGNGPAIAYLVIGALIGMFLGVIPGLGSTIILTVILAFIAHISLTGTLCLFLGTHAGSYFSASITSILLNTPAHPEAFAVTFDGFPMAQRGEAGRALGISAASTCLGGLIGCAILVGFLQVVNQLPLLFHPPEYVALITIALLLVGTLGTNSVSKALLSTGIALIISTIGPDPVTGVLRYTFNAVGLLGGISIVSLFLGLFAIPQMVLVFGTATTIARQNMMGQEVSATQAVRLEAGFRRQVTQGIFETCRHWVAVLRGGVIGAVTGVVPGIGGFAANFISYGVAQQTSKNRAQFGTGIPEGIIAPEASSLAKEAGTMVPLLGLGLPGGSAGALFLAALTIKDVRTGYGFVANYPVLAYETVWIIAIGGIIGTIAGVIAAPMLARVTRVPGPALVPFIMSVVILGAYAANSSIFSLTEILIFGIIGFTLRRLQFSLAAFGVGLVLGPNLETNIYLTRHIYPGVSFLSRPLADVLIAVAIGILVLKWFQIRGDKRKAQIAFDEKYGHLDDDERRKARIGIPAYPLLGLIATVVIVAFCIPFAIYAKVHYDATTAIMPFVGGSLAGLVGIWRLPFEIMGYRRYRIAKAMARSDGQSSAVEAVTSTVPSSAATSTPATPTLIETVDGIPQVPGRGGVPHDIGDILEAIGPVVQPSIGGSITLPAVRDKAWGRHGQYTRELIGFGCFISLVILVYLFGFLIGIPMFCLAYGMTATERFMGKSLVRRGIFAVGCALIMWFAAHEVFTQIHLVYVPKVHL